MKLPIFAYGNNVLKVKAQAVASDFPNLHELIANMWETMEKANGCGLAAPQVGKSLRLFVADSQLLYEAMDERDKIAYFEKGDTGIRRVFINPEVHHLINFLAKFFIFPVEIRLFLTEQVKIVLTRLFIILPSRPTKDRI